MSITKQTQELLYELLGRVDCPTSKDHVDIINVLNLIHDMEEEQESPKRCNDCGAESGSIPKGYKLVKEEV
jgi:hypothetical protein